MSSFATCKIQVEVKPQEDGKGFFITTRFIDPHDTGKSIFYASKTSLSVQLGVKACCDTMLEQVRECANAISGFKVYWNE